jgi:hypothetical protein
VTRAKLRAAIAEAKRFLKVAQLLEHESREDYEDKARMYPGSPLTAATRRASMDLTRALARMRAPR